MKHGKKYSDSLKLIDHLKQYDPEEAVDLVVQTGKAKFDETVEISVRLGVAALFFKNAPLQRL